MEIKRDKKGRLVYFKNGNYEERFTYKLGKVIWENNKNEKEITTYSIFGGRKVEFISNGKSQTYCIAKKGLVSKIN